MVDCPVCEKWFFNRKQMERHMRTHQNWIPTEMSPLGDNTPLQPTDFKNKHSILYCHECIECNVFFKSIKTLTKHKLDEHALRPVYKCAAASTECGRQFETVEEFLEHAQVHCQKNIVCIKCSIKFNSKNSLRHHMKVAHYRATGGLARALNPARTKTGVARASAKKIVDKSMNQGACLLHFRIFNKPL